MNPKLLRVTAGEMARDLERAGFRLTRQSGSHRIYRGPEGNRVTLPFHAGKVLHPKVVSSILRDAGLSAEHLRGLLKG